MAVALIASSNADAAYLALREMVKDELDIPPDDSYKDAKLLRTVKTAVMLAEKELRRTLFTKTWKLETWEFHTIHLPRPPFLSLTAEAVQYYDAEDVLQTLSTDAYEIANDPADYVGGSRPIDPAVLWFRDEEVCPLLLSVERPYPLIVNYTAGYGTTLQSLPEDMQTALSLLARHIFLYPDTCYGRMPAAVQHLLACYAFLDERASEEVGL